MEQPALVGTSGRSEDGRGGVEVAIDIGGTFTDVVCSFPDGGVRLAKLSSSRGDESAAVRAALTLLQRDWGVGAGDISRVVHGTTVATNAVLERKGARIGLLATSGFRDILEIGRQYRTDMYNLHFAPNAPTFLAPGARRIGVTERIGADGAVLVPLDESSARDAVTRLLAEGVEAIAVSFLFSFLNPAHERRVGAIIAEMAPHVAVSLSCDVDPAFREYERTCVTAFDAYVKPIMGRYLRGIEHDLRESSVPGPFQVMQSRGGLGRAETVVDRPVRLFLSGPAAGVIGGNAAGAALGRTELITVDIGGTSADIALVTGGSPAIRGEGSVDGYVIRVPMVDVNAVGSGGGSIAWIDGAGGLRVGPHSAGSRPGPACYGNCGTQPTITDASVVLGYIDPSYFAGGQIALDPALAVEAIRREIAEPLGITVADAALGMHRIVNAIMAEGIRLVSVRRGVDPRDYALVPLGGGGGVHGAQLAEELGITEIVVPLHPGVLSAAGLLAAPIEHELSAGVQRPLDGLDVDAVHTVLAGLDARCARLIDAEQWPGPREVRHSADVSYVGQSYTLEIPLDAGRADALQRLYRDFLAAHEEAYGHAVEGPAKLVNLRATHRQQTRRAVLDRFAPLPGEALKGRRPIRLDGHAAPVAAEVWDRPLLPAGAVLQGPAVIEQMDTTTVVPPGWTARVAENGTLVMTQDA